VSNEPPSATCPVCKEWVPCKYPILVSDPKEITGAKERWVSLESPEDTLKRHRKKAGH
jgi:hypothetical protein